MGFTIRALARSLGASVPIAAILTAAACSGPSTVGTNDDNNFSEKQLTGRSLPPKTLALTFDDGPGLRTKELSAFFARTTT